MMGKNTNVQIKNISRPIKEVAEEIAISQGFKSLSSALRYYIYQLANQKVKFAIPEILKDLDEELIVRNDLYPELNKMFAQYPIQKVYVIDRDPFEILAITEPFRISEAMKSELLPALRSSLGRDIKFRVDDSLPENVVEISAESTLIYLDQIR